MQRLSVFVFLCCASFSARAEQPSSADADISIRFFENQVRPILVEHCHKCHGPDKQQSSLRLDSLDAMLKGGDSGPAVEPGQPDASLLISAINHGDVVQMPPKYKLAQADIDVLTTWVKMGTPWPGAARPVRKEQFRDAVSKFTEAEKSYWAFQSPVKPVPPRVRDTRWPKSVVDYFILAGLEAKGMHPAEAAEKRALIRRATCDLHGLPPTPEEIQAFLADDEPDSFERLVDKLLNSPRYGEQWGRHWLDVARYADSNGADENRTYAHAWRYRDYVIHCFNADMPFDRFLVEQLAGDLLPASNIEARNRLWIATGFLTIGPKPLLANDEVKVEMDVVDEQIETLGRAFLGLSLGCARCHDHKFDPISAEDYYALAGIFKSTKVVDQYDLRICRTWTERALGSEADECRHLALKEKAAWCDDMRRLSDANSEQNKFIKQMEEVRAELATIPVAMAVREGNTIGNVHVHLRGNPQTLGREIPRSFPKVLLREYEPPMPTTQSGRLELAQWLARPEHPLTSRVIANRIWKWHLGEGIVRTPDDFGVMGQRPDNQALLDYLAVRFVECGWSVKAMHRLIMLSAAYQMSSRSDARALAADPENRLLWRMNRRRLEAEEIRDSLWFLGGAVDFQYGGPAIPASTNHEQFSKIQNSLKQVYATRRRAVYLPVMRSGLYDLFQTFDFADPSLPSGRRVATTVAPQALFLMNSDLVWEASRLAAMRLLQEHGDDSLRIQRIYELAFGRPPTDREIGLAMRFLQQYREVRSGSDKKTDHGDEPDMAVWQALCRVMMMTNEFLFVN